MKIFCASDHAGFNLKEKIVASLRESGFEVTDCGNTEYDEHDDYPDFIVKVAREISARPQEYKGIILGGSGQGEAMIANRFPHVRAAVFYGDRRSVTEEEMVLERTREHNDANILSLGARYLSEEEALSAVYRFLETPFSGEERHVRRIHKIEKYDRH